MRLRSSRGGVVWGIQIQWISLSKSCCNFLFISCVHFTSNGAGWLGWKIQSRISDFHPFKTGRHIHARRGHCSCWVVPLLAAVRACHLRGPCFALSRTTRPRGTGPALSCGFRTTATPRRREVRCRQPRRLYQPAMEAHLWVGHEWHTHAGTADRTWVRSWEPRWPCTGDGNGGRRLARFYGCQAGPMSNTFLLLGPFAGGPWIRLERYVGYRCEVKALLYREVSYWISFVFLFFGEQNKQRSNGHKQTKSPVQWTEIRVLVLDMVETTESL